MANLNISKAVVGGHLTSCPELKRTPNGVLVTSFTIAVNRPPKDDGTVIADFIDCVAWRERAEFVTKYFGKGSSICVVGTLQKRSYADNQKQRRYVTEVIADDIYFVDSKADAGAAGTQRNAASAANSQQTGAYMPQEYVNPRTPSASNYSYGADEDDDLPF